jgi:hypothetical protein
MIGLDIIDRDRDKRMAFVRFLPGLILLVLAFPWGFAFGEEIPPGQPPVPENVQPAKGALSANEGFIDRSHAYIDQKINGVVAWFDGLFGVPHERDAVMAKNRLKWSNELRVEKGESLRYRSSLRAYLSLPKFEKRIKLVIIQENSEDAVVPIPIEPGTPAVNTPTKANSLRAVNTELRYYAHDTKTAYAFLAAGSRFVWLPETFVRSRLLWRRTLADNTFISPSVTPFWQDHLGFGVTPQLDFGHPFPRDHIFLWANSATFFRNRTGFLWGSEVSLSRILSPVTAIAVAVGASGATQASAVTDNFNMAANNYRVSLRYRRSIFRPWLFLELVPETNWRRKEGGGREFIPAFTVRVEMNTLGSRALLPVPLIVNEPLPIPVTIPGYDPQPALR